MVCRTQLKGLERERSRMEKVQTKLHWKDQPSYCIALKSRYVNNTSVSISSTLRRLWRARRSPRCVSWNFTPAERYALVVPQLLRCRLQQCPWTQQCDTPIDDGAAICASSCGKVRLGSMGANFHHQATSLYGAEIPASEQVREIPSSQNDGWVYSTELRYRRIAVVKHGLDEPSPQKVLAWLRTWRTMEWEASS